jgi:hypothetical protein
MGNPKGIVGAGGPGDCISPRSNALDRGFSREAVMNKRKRVKLIQEGHYVAEVDVDLLEDETGWSPYLSPEDAYKLDDVRDALRRGDLQAASVLARVYEMRPVASR